MSVQNVMASSPNPRIPPAMLLKGENTLRVCPVRMLEGVDPRSRQLGK